MNNHSAKASARQLVQAFLSYGLQTVVISPGSRNAPLIIEFSAYPQIEIFSIPDERSASFFALGLSVERQTPVALLCTSGSAVLNYYPAVAEAYNSSVPLLVISADRPFHLIGVGEGQTIYQQGVLERHTGLSVHLTEDDIDRNNQVLNRAFGMLIGHSVPVHINMEFDEPLYEISEDSTVLFVEKDLMQNAASQDASGMEEYLSLWAKAQRKLILVSGVTFDPAMQEVLEKFAKDDGVVVMTENTANVHGERFIECIDRVLTGMGDPQAYRPDLLITFGNTVISKKIKQFLRRYPPVYHWHIDRWRAWNTYGVLTHSIQMEPLRFMRGLPKPDRTENGISGYQKLWMELKEKQCKRHGEFIGDIPFSDLKVFDFIHQNTATGVRIEWANSTAVRYAQLFPWSSGYLMHANRGTSGIDGSVSTAVGRAYASDEPLLMVTGDISFLYDKNAFWHTYVPEKLKILLINNGGGGIFRFIPGPGSSGALELFETPHHYTAEHLAAHYGLKYLKAGDESGLRDAWQQLWESEQPAVLEVFTPREKNAEVLKDYFSYLSK